ncbi:excalibur calcium-binding domain-containing protein [Phenylobacterium sp. LH3H17]|uniref:excalibur calcium-binding domain-containing protein n=1 Tax=Phenylobacterium sp. LH3H17 TaxID=2903901 RepID=UPI00353134E6
MNSDCGLVELGARPSFRPWGRETLLLLALVAGLSAPSLATAHGGGLNAEGCHNNRKTGDYHCHRARGAASGAQAPSRPSSSQPLGFSSRPVGGAYANCTAARAAGAAPIRRGEPGYGPHLDRDNDGVACEPYRGR